MRTNRPNRSGSDRATTALRLAIARPARSACAERTAPPPARLPRRWALGIAVACVLSAPAPAQARDGGLTFYGGYRDGGSLRDTRDETRQRLAAAPAWALSLDLGLDGARQRQFYLSVQRTDLRLTPAAWISPAPAGERTLLPMTVVHAHLGGTYFFDGPVGAGPYVVGGIGGALYRPGPAGYADLLRPSLNLGLGYQWGVGDRLALRAEVRGYFTLVDSRGGLFCGNGCLIAIKGDGITQGAAQVGLTFRF